MTYQPPAADSSAAHWSLFTPPPTTQRMLGLAHRESSHRVDLYAALLRGRVYVTAFEVVLGVDCPFVEFQPSYDRAGAVLTLYTSRGRMPGATSELAEGMPFRDVLRQLPPGVRLLIDPDHEGFVVTTAEVAMLRRLAQRGDA